MEISRPKTKVMQVGRQTVSPVKEADIAARLWPKNNTTWEPANAMEDCMDKVNEFWSLHPQLDPMGVQECDGEHRCKVCCKITKTEPALKRHYTKGKGGCPFRVKPAKGSSKTKRVVVGMKKVKA